MIEREGGCDRRFVRYRGSGEPMFVRCCHSSCSALSPPERLARFEALRRS